MDLASSDKFFIASQEFLADLETPVSLFLKLGKESSSSFLLESVEQGESLGRHSFLGFDPEAVYELYGDHWKVTRGKRVEKMPFKDPLLLLKKELSAGKGLPNGGDYPSCLGGFVGFIAYETVRFFEKIRPRKKKESSQLPLAVFFKVHRFILFDHVERKMKLVALFEKRLGAKQAQRLFEKQIVSVQSLLKHTLRETSAKQLGKSYHFKPNMSRSGFIRSVRKIKEYIRAGDIIQAVYSQRFDLGALKDSFSFYRILRSLNPSPYMFFFKHKDLELAGSSPELLVRKKSDRAELRPIAGTRPRGRTAAQDLKLETQLRRSIKERAEHLMLVDLARNDLGRVCDYRSVSVKEFERVERYSHVMHLVSDVEGKLKKSCDSLDLLRSVFPAGTLSGAPKVRAMEIIDELEESERGPYGGSLGYMSYNGDMDMCITIRTLLTYKGRSSVQAGAGIVFDSDPAKEYQECHNKAMALFKAFKST